MIDDRMKNKNPTTTRGGPAAIYQAKNGAIAFRQDLAGDTIWGTQKQIAELFEIDRSVVTRHINNLLKNKEISEKSNVHNMHIANSDKPVKIYSLDVILSVGYRTNSSKATAFRIWATKTYPISEFHQAQEAFIAKQHVGNIVVCP